MAVSYDVIVAGGGPAGVAAAIAAARNGAKTLLIEANGSLGGTVTNGSLPAFCPFGNTDEPLIRGIGLELLEALRAETKLPAYYDKQKPYHESAQHLREELIEWSRSHLQLSFFFPFRHGSI